MIPVVNHGRKTGNPEPGLLRHVLFRVFTIPFRMFTGILYMFYIVILLYTTISIYIPNSPSSKVDAPQSVSGLNDRPVHGEQGAQSPGLLISPDNHRAGSHGMDKVSLRMTSAWRGRGAGSFPRPSPIWS